MSYPNWDSMSPTELCDALEAHFHRPLTIELPKLQELIEEVVVAEQAKHRELSELAQIYTALRIELSEHMLKEEMVLFPVIRARGEAPPPPIQRMRYEHEETTDALRRMRELTHDYVAPEGASDGHRMLLAGLAKLDRDLCEHIRVENEVLFPVVSH